MRISFSDEVLIWAGQRGSDSSKAHAHGDKFVKYLSKTAGGPWGSSSIFCMVEFGSWLTSWSQKHHVNSWALKIPITMCCHCIGHTYNLAVRWLVSTDSQTSSFQHHLHTIFLLIEYSSNLDCDHPMLQNDIDAEVYCILSKITLAEYGSALFKIIQWLKTCLDVRAILLALYSDQFIHCLFEFLQGQIEIHKCSEEVEEVDITELPDLVD